MEEKYVRYEISEIFRLENITGLELQEKNRIGRGVGDIGGRKFKQLVTHTYSESERSKCLCACQSAFLLHFYTVHDTSQSNPATHNGIGLPMSLHVIKIIAHKYDHKST